MFSSLFGLLVVALSMLGLLSYSNISIADELFR